MKTKDEMKSVPSFDDLVFENRNKDYGAYKMRKKYNAALIWALFVSVFFIGATVLTPFVIYRVNPIVVELPKNNTPVEFTNPSDPNEIRQPELPKQEEIKINHIAYVAPEVVESLPMEEANKFATMDDLNSTVKNDSVVEFNPDTKTDEIIPDIDNKIVEIFKVTERPFFGTEGDNEFRRWVAQNVIYPQSAIDANMQGRVYVQFVIEKDGSLSNVKVARSVDPELDQEAVRVIASSPKWSPGKQQGAPVRVNYSFPITFTIK